MLATEKAPANKAIEPDIADDRWVRLADTEEGTARELEARLARGQVPEAHMDATMDLIAESRDLAERCRRRG